MNSDWSMYWSMNRTNEEANKEIRKTASTLFFACADPEPLPFKEKIKWLVKLKIISINDHLCKYCNFKQKYCPCDGYCVRCNKTHSGYLCKKNIMNSKLLKIIFHSSNVRNKITSLQS